MNSDAGYLLRYRKEAAEKGLPHFQTLRICRVCGDTTEAIVTKHPMVSALRFPDLPKRFPTYESAFEYVEALLS